MQDTPSLTSTGADSLVGSLCREMAGLRQLWHQLSGLRSQCREERLLQRLSREVSRLEQRRLELQHLARQLQRLPLRDPLGVSLLLELTVRPLAS